MYVIYTLIHKYKSMDFIFGPAMAEILSYSLFKTSKAIMFDNLAYIKLKLTFLIILRLEIF